VLRTKLDAGRPVTRREANPAVPRAGFCRGNNHVTQPPRRRPESSVARWMSRGSHDFERRDDGPGLVPCMGNPDVGFTWQRMVQAPYAGMHFRFV
jgi:hypothetical protein